MNERDELRRKFVPSIHEKGAMEIITQEKTAENW
jgi:hypothetical protein